MRLMLSSDECEQWISSTVSPQIDGAQQNSVVGIGLFDQSIESHQQPYSYTSNNFSSSLLSGLSTSMITTNLNLESGHESGQLNNSLESLICSQLIDQHYHTSFKSGSEYSNDFNLTVEPVTDCFKLLSSSPPSIQSHHQSSLGLMRQGSIPAYQNTESQPWMIDILSAQCHIRPFSSDSSVQPLEPESQLTINPSLIDPSGQSPYPQNILCHQKYRCDWPTSCCCCCSTDNSSETSSSILHPNLISPILGTQLGTGKEPFHSDPSRPDLSSFVPQNPVELDPRSVRLENPMDCHQSDDNEVRYKDWIELDYQETERIDDTFQAEPSSVSDSTSPLSPSSSRKTSSSTDVCLTSSNSSNSPQISFPKQSQSTNQRSKLKLLNKSKSNTRPRTKTKTKRPKEFLERNRLAAFRSRQKKKILEIELESKLIELESQSNNLKLILESLLLEKLKLKNIIEQHHHHHHHHQSNCNNINRSKIKN